MPSLTRYVAVPAAALMLLVGGLGAGTSHAHEPAPGSADDASASHAMAEECQRHMETMDPPAMHRMMQAPGMDRAMDTPAMGRMMRGMAR
jgi:hypothetical protein